MLALADIQLSMEDSEITKPHLDRERSAQANSFLSFRQEEEYLHLNSCSLWLQAGGKNSSFLHKQCRAKLSRNHISEIHTSEDEVTKGHLQIQLVSHFHFHQLLTEDDISDNEVNANFLSNIPSLVTAKSNVGLVKPFSEIEIVDVIWAMDIDKFPR